VELQPRARDNGDVLSAISDGLVGLLKEFYGRGPTRAKSYYQDDLVVCVLRGGFTRVEETLLEGGRGPAVIHQRRLLTLTGTAGELETFDLPSATGSATYARETVWAEA
jgi:uncharacterized protein YbcI